MLSTAHASQAVGAGRVVAPDKRGMTGVQGTKMVAQPATDGGEDIGRYPEGHPASLLHTYEENDFGERNLTCRLCLAEDIVAVYPSVNQLIGKTPCIFYGMEKPE